MRTVIVRARSKKISIEKTWNILSDVEKYPGRVKFVKKVVLHGRGRMSGWYDITTILWIPMRLEHIVTVYKTNKEYAFDVPLIFGGIMKQSYKISSDDQKSTIINASISFDLGNELLNNTVGLYLRGRLEDMLKTTLINFGGEIV